MASKPIKPKHCATCGAEFIPWRTTQKVCGSIRCAREYVITKEAEKARKAQKRETRAARQRLKSVTELLDEAQVPFNRYIRLRDRDEPCISCGRFHEGQWHAGHYRTVGAAGHLRFNEDNVHKQCAPCNNHKSGNVTEYRINLVKKIGVERVEALENNNEIKRWTREEAVAIKAHYAQRVRELEKELAIG